ncbi:DUF5305 family protein [Haloplanus halobius]|uniref:DUF5305 family protein n=1 Tax=Haloplanus halobius TaxID=2934938 RepID=UPI00200EBF1D|nr:DUF5305 family protein [Haloplanus sp. XH21]
MYALTRFKHLVWSHGPTIVVAFLILTLGGAAMTGWMQVNPKTTTVTDHHDRQTAELEAGTLAVVDGENGLYPEGAHLRNKPFHFYDSTPTVTLVTTTSIPEATQADISHRVSLVYRVVRGDEQYWEQRRTIQRTQATGTTVASNATLDMVSVHDKARQIARKAGGDASVVVQVEIHTQYTTGNYEGEITKTLAVEHGSEMFSLPHGTWTQDHSRTSTRTVTLDRPWWMETGPPFATGLGILGLLAVGITRRRIGDPERLEYEVHRERYREWISTGVVSSDLPVTVTADTLEDLVDVAIDKGERVMHDRDSGHYFVLVDGSAYVFTPPTGETAEMEWVSDTNIERETKPSLLRK